MPENIDQPDLTPEWWCGACPDPDECTATSTCTLMADQQARHRQVDALIAAARSDTRDRLAARLAAELAHTDELLARCDAAAETGDRLLLTAARQLVDEHRHAVETLAALIDAPDKERPQLLAAVDEHQHRVLETLIVMTGRQAAEPPDPSDRPHSPDPWDRPQPEPEP